VKNGRVCKERVSLLLQKDQSMYSGLVKDQSGLVAGETETRFLQALAGCLSGNGSGESEIGGILCPFPFDVLLQFAGEKTGGTTQSSPSSILRCFDGGGGEVYATGGSWWPFPLGVVVLSGDSNIGMGLLLPFSDTTSSCLAGFLSGSGGGVSGRWCLQIGVSIRHTEKVRGSSWVDRA